MRLVLTIIYTAFLGICQKFFEKTVEKGKDKGVFCKGTGRAAGAQKRGDKGYIKREKKGEIGERQHKSGGKAGSILQGER